MTQRKPRTKRGVRQRQGEMGRNQRERLERLGCVCCHVEKDDGAGPSEQQEGSAAEVGVIYGVYLCRGESAMWS